MQTAPRWKTGFSRDVTDAKKFRGDLSRRRFLFESCRKELFCSPKAVSTTLLHRRISKACFLVKAQGLISSTRKPDTASCRNRGCIAIVSWLWRIPIQSTAKHFDLVSRPVFTRNGSGERYLKFDCLQNRNIFGMNTPRYVTTAFGKIAIYCNRAFVTFDVGVAINRCCS